MTMTQPTGDSSFAVHSANFPIANFGGPPPAVTIAKSPAPADKNLLPPLPLLPSTHVWGVDYSVVNMAQTIDFIDLMILRGEPNYVITANLNYSMLCAEHPRLASFTQRCRLVLCDGMPILWRSKLNKKKLPERVAGADLIYALMELSAARGYRVFFMGGEEGIAEAASERLRTLYPRLKVAGVESPPFRALSPEEHSQLRQRIQNAKPDILLVAFGQPKGEFWIEDNYQTLGVPVCIQLGATFDFIVGKARRAPAWVQRIGMEWLFRALSDPHRLIPRYTQNAWFLLKAVRQELLQATR